MRILKSISCITRSAQLKFTKLRVRCSWFTVALCVTFVTPVAADDTEIYFGGATTELPNILFILDVSGSMRSPGASGATRMEEMQNALSLLIGGVPDEEGNLIGGEEDVNIGLMSFSFSRVDDVRVEDVVVTLPVGNIDAVGNIPGNREAALEEIAALAPQGGTPTLRALEYGRRYFSGELHENPLDSTSPILPSPIAHECQANHIVLITDGAPDGEPTLVEELEVDPLNKECLRQDINGEENNGNCGAEIAYHMANNDLLPNSLVGKNTVTTHTIGFNFIDPWLATLSSEETGGAGSHHNVESIQQLREALAQIFNTVGTASFAAPTVSTNSFNESRHRDELYYSQFRPSNSVRWTGNIKKYRLLDGVVVDVNEEPVLDEAGNVAADSTSLWSNVADGAAVADGGFAALLPLPAERNWFTDFNVDPDASGSLTPARVTLDTRDSVSSDVLGAESDLERDTLVAWALGADVPLAPDDNHFYVADALHGTPQLLSYKASSTTDPKVLTEVLYSATNLGVLHAIDPATGQELWSYTPEEFLPNIKQYFDNEVLEERVYGLDGEIAVHSIRADTPDAGYDFEVEEAYVYLTERRGGNRVYGLDVSNGYQSENPFTVMWKITGGIEGDPFVDLAQTWSKPELINVRFGCPDACEERELLMFSGGYNNTVYDDVDFDYAIYEDEANVPPSGHGNAVYLVDPQTGELVWSAGNGDHHSVNLGIKHSIPSTPLPIDTNVDGYVDLLYFVDLGGDVYRVDLSKGNSEAGQLHLSGGQIAALNPEGESLRFFNQLDVSISGLNFSTSNFFLSTGSGMRNSPLNIEPFNNRLYVITDSWTQDTPNRLEDGERIVDYRYVVDETGERDIIRADDNILRNLSDDSSTTSVLHGFYRPLPLGEKVLTPTATRASRVFAATFVPPGSVSERCAGQVGTSRLYVLALPDGENALPEGLGDENLVIGEGILNSGVLVDVGGEDAPFLLFDKKSIAFKDLITGTPEVYRRFQRTGWVEQDEY